MRDPILIKLRPLGDEFEVERATPLQDVLFAHGVEFPCGGRAHCKGCRVRVLEGSLPVTPDQERVLTREELEAGWRLSCLSKAEGDLTLELAQWEVAVLSDTSDFQFTPRHGLGVAVDLGTTTLVAQLLDLQTADVLAVRTAINPQARHGSDIMSRVAYAMSEDGQHKLEQLIRRQVEKLMDELAEAAGIDSSLITDVVIVGNTVMHHLFCRIDVEPLSHYPFKSPAGNLMDIHTEDLGWKLKGKTSVRFLPCIGGFVGSDILAGVLATKLHRSTSLAGLVDLGTNGEIVIGNQDRILCTSTAAGPAFEGARISMGMRASTGAIAEVVVSQGKLSCRVLGNVSPRGICGSGLVDAVAACLELGSIQHDGKIAKNGGPIVLCSPVSLSQADVRELQLAKAAIAAGIRILLEELGASPYDLARLYLAGAFGNYVNRASAMRIGLIKIPLEKVEPAGNTALLGAKIALFQTEDGDSIRHVKGRIEHVVLSDYPQFQDIYVEEMSFPK